MECFRGGIKKNLPHDQVRQMAFLNVLVKWNQHSSYFILKFHTIFGLSQSLAVTLYRFPEGEKNQNNCPRQDGLRVYSNKAFPVFRTGTV